MSVTNPSLVEVRDEGVSQGQVTALDFVGASVTAAVSGTTGTITVSAGGSASWTTVEQDLGAIGAEHWRGKFTLTDAAISGASKVIIQQAPGPYTGKGTLADEAEMDPLWCVAAPGSGQATVYWRSMLGISPASAGYDATALPTRVVGKVRGNVKFCYTVA